MFSLPLQQVHGLIFHRTVSLGTACPADKSRYEIIGSSFPLTLDYDSKFLTSPLDDSQPLQVFDFIGNNQEKKLNTL
jgi:hypothetical protein